MTSTTVAAPLYITVGPPCAGKTTWVRRKQQQQQQQIQETEESKTLLTIHDVTIDDQDGVYVPVPTSWFLLYNEDATPAADAARSLILHGKSAFDRIQKDQVELVTILSRLANQISKDTCQLTLKKVFATTSTTNEEASNGILAAVEEYIEKSSSCTKSSRIQLPETIDLFVVEALFRPDPTRTTTTTTVASSAIERAGQALRNYAISDTIVWGNTNCRSTDYQDALQLAVRQKRPVHFVVYSEVDKDDNDTSTETITATTTKRDERQSVHARNLQELFQRSIARLVQTGRYVPANVIMDMRRRCLEMTTINQQQHPHQQHHGATTTGLELECHLARLAQYELDPVTRMVRPLPSKRRRSNDQQQQHQQQQNQQPNHLYRPQPPQRGGIYPSVGRFPQPWRGGIRPGMNHYQHQYGNYHTNTTTTATATATTRNNNPRGGQRGGRTQYGNYHTSTNTGTRGGRWGERTQEHGGGRYNNSSDLQGRGTNTGAWR